MKKVRTIRPDIENRQKILTRQVGVFNNDDANGSMSHDRNSSR
jgi:hypothetical protein